MQRLAFKMKLIEGCEEAYKKRHDAIWPELQLLLKEHGISDYAIFLDKATHELIGVLKAEDSRKLDALPQQPIMQQWWHFMHDLMETNPDHSPVQIPLQEVFYLP